MNEIVADVPTGMRQFTNIQDFLEANRMVGDAVHHEANICKVLAWASGWQEIDSEVDNSPGIPIPWVTLVLGAEVLDSLPPALPQDVFMKNLEDRLLGESACGSNEFPISAEARDITQFAWTLLQSRNSMRHDRTNKTTPPKDDESDSPNKTPTSSEDDREPEDSPKPNYDPIQLNAVVAAFAVTRAYFFSKLVQHAPINREEDQIFDAVALGFRWNDSQKMADPEAVFWDRARVALSNLTELTKPSNGNRPSNESSDKPRAAQADQADMIWQLANLMQISISKENSLARVSSGSLLLLTEIAWHYLVDTLRKTHAPNAYHDWAEQLITIDMQSDSSVTPNSNRARFLNGTEPLGVAYKVASDAIKRELTTTTTARNAHLVEVEGWIRNGEPEKLSSHDWAYRAYCDLLHSQAAVRQRAAELKADRRRAENRDNERSIPTLTPETAGNRGPFDLVPKRLAGQDAGTKGDQTATSEPMTSGESASGRRSETLTDDGRDVLSMEMVPYAVAVVTTFDIELELALWHFHHEPFMVILPVNIVQETDTIYKGQQVWMGYVVRPTLNSDAAVKAITNPEENSFFLIESGAGESEIAELKLNSDRLGDTNMPIVVKLCGSPLVTLPEFPIGTGRLQEESKLAVFRDLEKVEVPVVKRYWGAGKGANPKRPELRHGLVIEDFQAMVAALPEADSTAKLTLPADLRGSVSPGYWRYWTLLGVDLADSALRYRLIGQMLGSTFGTGAPRRQRRTGVAINHERSVNRKALSLMQWRQIEVVQDDALAFRHALAHYIEHLNDKQFLTREVDKRDELGQPIKSEQIDPVSRQTWTFHGDPCQLKDERRRRS